MKNWIQNLNLLKATVFWDWSSDVVWENVVAGVKGLKVADLPWAGLQNDEGLNKHMSGLCGWKWLDAPETCISVAMWIEKAGWLSKTTPSWNQDFILPYFGILALRGVSATYYWITVLSSLG